jgi:hypothetical protein
LLDDSKKWSIHIDTAGIGLLAGWWADARMKEIADDPDGPEVVNMMKKLADTLQILNTIPFPLDLWRTQNMYFAVKKAMGNQMHEKAHTGDENAQHWVAAHDRLGDCLHIKV